jgi:hypothetical protein
MGELNDDDPNTLVPDLPNMTKEELFLAQTILHEWVEEDILLGLANQ